MIIQGKKRYQERLDREPVERPKGRKSMTQPDMALTVEKILERFVRGLQVDVKQGRGVYTDSPVDLERLARLDPADKEYEAQAYAQRAKDAQAELEAMSEAARTEEYERSEEQTRSGASKPAEAGSGIGSLDNTMPDDTNLNDSQLGSKKSSKKR